MSQKNSTDNPFLSFFCTNWTIFHIRICYLLMTAHCHTAHNYTGHSVKHHVYTMYISLFQFSYIFIIFFILFITILWLLWWRNVPVWGSNKGNSDSYADHMMTYCLWLTSGHAMAIIPRSMWARWGCILLYGTFWRSRLGMDCIHCVEKSFDTFCTYDGSYWKRRVT